MSRASLAKWMFLLLHVGSTPICPASNVAVTEPWTLPYRTLHETVQKIGDEIARNFFPELMIIKNGDTIASIPVDAFGAKVLREADLVLFPYREGVQHCIGQSQNEYREAKVHSFEYFGWFLDSYARTLVRALGSHEQSKISEGVTERKVTTDRALYAYTRLIAGYLEERQDQFREVLEPGSYAADNSLQASLQDIGRRVFHLDLSQKFDRREAVEKGLKSQPVLRDLASVEGGADLTLGLDPIERVSRQGRQEPACQITLPPRGDQVAKSE